MEEEHEANQSCREEKELSFSINRILQSNDGVKKVDERCNDTIKCRCTVAVQGCQCFSSNTACKISEDRAQDTIIPYPWQMLSKQTNRRIGHPYQSRAAPKRKKPRTTFSRAQITELEDLFTEKKYLTSSERQKVADYLNLTDCQVKTWFQNRRTKWKRETEEEKEEQRHALNRTMLNLQKDRMFPLQDYQRLKCNANRT